MSHDGACKAGVRGKKRARSGKGASVERASKVGGGASSTEDVDALVRRFGFTRAFAKSVAHVDASNRFLNDAVVQYTRAAITLASVPDANPYRSFAKNDKATWLATSSKQHPLSTDALLVLDVNGAIVIPVTTESDSCCALARTTLTKSKILTLNDDEFLTFMILDQSRIGTHEQQMKTALPCDERNEAVLSATTQYIQDTFDDDVSVHVVVFSTCDVGDCNAVGYRSRTVHRRQDGGFPLATTAALSPVLSVPFDHDVDEKFFQRRGAAGEVRKLLGFGMHAPFVNEAREGSRFARVSGAIAIDLVTALRESSFDGPALLTAQARAAPTIEEAYAAQTAAAEGIIESGVDAGASPRELAEATRTRSETVIRAREGAGIAGLVAVYRFNLQALRRLDDGALNAKLVAFIPNPAPPGPAGAQRFRSAQHSVQQQSAHAKAVRRAERTREVARVTVRSDVGAAALGVAFEKVATIALPSDAHGGLYSCVALVLFKPKYFPLLADVLVTALGELGAASAFPPSTEVHTLLRAVLNHVVLTTLDNLEAFTKYYAVACANALIRTALNVDLRDLVSVLELHDDDVDGVCVSAIASIVVERALSAFKDGVLPLLAEHAPPSQTSVKAARRASAQCLCASLAHVFSKKSLARYLVSERRRACRIADGDDPHTSDEE